MHLDLKHLLAVVAMFEAVIFDWDGTLAKTTSVIVASFHKVLDERHIKVSEGLIESRTGTSAREIFLEILRTSGVSFDEGTVRNLVEKRVEAELAMSDQVRLNAGALDLLESLKGKVKLALASMNNKAVINRMLTACELRGFFDVVLSADEVLRPKPDPEIFLKCASKLGLQPERCVVVEDSVFGVRAAKAARMRCITVLSGAASRNELEQEHPDSVVASLEQKEVILKCIFSS
jgi:HAD superfamily hydrolase (TIGR01509 family)